MKPFATIRVAEARENIRAAIDPKSINAEARTFEVVWSTGAAAPMAGNVDGTGWIEFDEVLSLEPEAWDLARVEAGTCPLLNDHDGFWSSSGKGVAGQLGRVLSVTFTRREARAVCQFSFDPAHEGTWLNVQKGIIRGVSPRYRVSRYEEISKPKAARRTFRAAKCELREISLTSIPADAGGHVRAGDREPTYVAELFNGAGDKENMEPEVDPNATPQPNQQTPATPPEKARGVQPPQQPAPTPAPAPARVEPPAPSQPTHEQIRAAERARVSSITEAARSLRVDVDDAGRALLTRLVDSGASLEQARSELMFERARRDSAAIAPSIVSVGATEQDKVRAGMENALENRCGVRDAQGRPVALSDAGRPFRGMTLVRMAEESLRRSGVDVSGLSPMEIAGRALGLEQARGGGMHTTSDFPNLLSNLAGKTLRDAYNASPSNWKLISRKVTANDFKPLTRLQIGDAPQLEKVNEHGEFKRGTVTESKESFAVETYGKVFTITRKAIVNDDTGAFDRLPAMFGRQAAELEAAKAIGLLLANPTMNDGNQLISSAHANTTTGVISLTSLQAALLLLMKQTGLDGRTLVGNTPKYLIVPAALEVLARQYVTQITPAQASNVNPFVGMFDRIIVEPRLDVGVDGQAGDAVKWWMTGDPAQVDMLEHAYLGGQEGVYLEQQTGFHVDGIELKARHDFGVAAIDWRGFVRSTGA